MPEELWTEICNIVQKAQTKIIPKKKKWKKAKWLFEEVLQTAEKRKVKIKRKRERYNKLEAEFQRRAKSYRKAFLNKQCKEIEENNRIGKTRDRSRKIGHVKETFHATMGMKKNRRGKTRDLFKKTGDRKGTFHAKIGTIKDRNGKELIEAEKIKKRWQEYTEELYKKVLHDQDNKEGMITHLKPDILECEVKWALGRIIMNKASGGDGIPVEIFQILKEDAVKVLHSICRQRKTQQWPQDRKRSVFIPIPKKGNAKECSNYHTIALISHTSKVILKILQARLQQYVNYELPDAQVGFRKGIGTTDQIANICWVIEKAREFQKNIYFCFMDYAKAFACVDHNKLWKILKEMGYQTTLTASREICTPVKKQQLEPDMEEQTGSKLGKEYVKAYIVTLLI